MKIANLITKLLVCVSLMATSAVFGASHIWTNSVGTQILNTAGNWSPSGTPSANGDILVFDNSTNLGTLVWNASFGPSSGSAAPGGLAISYTGTNNLTIACAVTGNPQFGLGNVTNALGSGVLTFGDSSITNNALIFRQNNVVLINNSTNAAVIMPNVNFGNGGGAGGRPITYGGTGNWVFNGPAFNNGALGFGGFATAVLVMSGTGSSTLFLNTNNFHGGGTTLNSGTISMGNSQALGTGPLTIVGGNLDSSIVNLVNANNNAQNWNGNFGFIGTQNLNIGSGAVTMGATRIVTVSNNTFEVDGVISGAGGLAKAGAGTLFLNNANTYSGGTTISNGVVMLGVSGAITNVGNVTVYGTLDINGNSTTLVNLGGTGIVDTVSGGTPLLTVSNTSSSTFSGVIKNTGGTLALTKVGASTLTLGGANTYTGNTTVSAGTLLINGSTASGSAVTVASGATLGGTNTVGGTVNWQSGSSASFTVTPNAAVSGSNSTPLTVSGSVTLNNNAVTVNIPGATPLAPGTYNLMSYSTGGSSGSFATGVPTYTGANVQAGTASTISTSGGTVILSVTLTGISATWTNNANSTWSAVTNWSSNPSYPHIAGDGATFGVGSAYATVTLDTPVSVGLVAFTNANSFLVADSGSPLTFDNTGVGAAISVTAGSSNAIAPVIALNDTLAVSTASGTLVAITNTVSNTSGAKTLTKNGAGTLVLSGNNTYGPATGTVGTILGGGILQLGNNSSAGAGDLSVSSSSTVRAGAALTLANNIIAGSGATATLDNNGNNVTLSGAISGAGALAKSGAGTLTLGSANSYAGNTTINAGTVVLNNASGIPGGATYGNVTLNTNTLLNLNGNSVVLNGLNSPTNTAATVDTLSGGSVTLTVGESGANGTFYGSISNTSGSLTLVKDGAGTETLGGANGYTGGTTINAGTLQIGNGGTSGNLGSGALLDNGILGFNLTGTNAFTGVIAGSGGVLLNNTNLALWLGGNNTFSGGITNNGGALWVTNSGELGVGPKTVLCANPNSTIHLDGSLGSLSLDGSIAFYLSGSAGVLFNEAGNNTISGTVGMYNGNGNPYIVVNSGTLTLAGGVTTIAGQNNRALVLGGAGNGTISGKVTEAAPGSPQTSLTKQDAGTWTLSYAGNDYSGATTVSGGTLIINAGANNTGNGVIAVNSGGTLIINGDDFGSGVVTVATNGTLGGIGTCAAVTFQAGAQGSFTAATPLTAYGNVILTNNPLTVYTGGTPLTPGTYSLLSIGGSHSISGSFAITPTITGAGIASGNVYFVTTSSSQVALVVATSSVWTNNANGNWTTGANWDSNPNFPNGVGQVATLGVGSSLITVNLDASETVGGVSFTNSNSFVITNTANVLSMNNSGNGATINVTAGTANSIASGVSLDDTTTVSTSVGTALSIPGGVNGGGALTATGNGVVTLSGANGYSGVTTLGGGTLVLGSTTAIGSGTLTISGGSLDSSVPNLVNANNNAQNWNGSFGFLGSQNLNLGSGSVALASGGATVTVSSNNLTVGGIISGSGVLTKAGNGTLVLAVASGALTGGVTIGAGTVVIGDDLALGSGTITFSGTNSTIQSVDSTARTLTNSVTATSGGIYAGTGNLTFSGAISTGNFPKTFMISNAITTFSGFLNDGGTPNGPNTKDGPGTLVLSGSNTLTKAFSVNNGTLALGSTNALGSGALTMSGGGLDSTLVNLVNANNNAQIWAASFYFAGSQNLNIGIGSVTMNANTTITVSNNTLTVGGGITGATRSLTKSGSGTLVLSGANTYSNTTVTAGTLAIAQATLATNSTVAISNSAVLQLNFSTTNQVVALVLGGTSQASGVYKAANSGGLITGTGALLVVPLTPPINTNAPAMQVSISGSTLNLAWPTNAGWILQSNSVGLASSSAWFNYPANGAVDVTNVSITINPAKTNVFFRMVKP